jgi:hypothetical protein
MAVAMVLSFFEAESLLPWEQDSCLLFYKSIRKLMGVGRRIRTRKKTLRRGRKSETTMDGKTRERGR